MESIIKNVMARLGGNALELSSNVRYVYRSSGQPIAFIKNGNAFSLGLRWIGFLRNLDEMYSADDGTFMGYLLHDGRLVRVRGESLRPKQNIPSRPSKPSKPTTPNHRNRMRPLPPRYVDAFPD